MPVTYRIDAASGVIRTRCTGPATLEEVVGHFRDLARDPACPERLDVLLDLSEMTSLPRPDQLRVVSDEIGRVRGRVRFDACAIVAPRDALFGMSRMFEVFTEQQFRITRVFREIGEAEDWLKKQRSHST